MTKKYYGIWDKERKEWITYYPAYWHRGKITNFYLSSKIIEGIHLYLNKRKLQEDVRLPQSLEIREFTPIDALLAKCGKND